MSTIALATNQILADHYDGPGGWWPIFPILWFLFLIAVFFVFARFGWWGRRRWYDEHRREAGTHAGTARLAERFAAGEIDEEEYRSRLAVLQETSQREDGR